MLTTNGVWVGCAGGGGDVVGPFPRMIAALFMSMVSTQEMRSFMAAPNAKDLRLLQELTEAHGLRPVVQIVPLQAAASALHDVGLGHGRGQTFRHVASDA